MACEINYCTMFLVFIQCLFIKSIYRIEFKVITLLIVLMLFSSIAAKRKTYRQTQNPYTKTICMDLDNTLRARRKTCFLRPDTGPCRADIVQWYFDVKQRRCYRFFWGGCQGNGNRFDSQQECHDYCHLNTTKPILHTPHFCSLAFDYGTCFGYFNRWGWDRISKTCKRRLYSGCGGNQNNFESRAECLSTCLRPPNNTMIRFNKLTTCVPFHIAELQ